MGATILEELDLLVDCPGQRLLPNPAHPDQPVFRAWAAWEKNLRVEVRATARLLTALRGQAAAAVRAACARGSLAALYAEVRAVVPQVGFGEGEALDRAGSNRVTLPRPKGGSKREIQSSPTH